MKIFESLKWEITSCGGSSTPIKLNHKYNGEIGSEYWLDNKETRLMMDEEQPRNLYRQSVSPWITTLLTETLRGVEINGFGMDM